MGMGFNETIQVMKTVNTEAAKVAAKQEIGGMLNDRLIKIVQPKLPIMIRGYAETEIGKLALANAFAAAIVNFGYENDKLTLAAEAMTYAAMKDFVEGFNFREMVDEFLDGVDLSVLETKKEGDK
jgi:hypothetical protein